jgi:hypothetical protein
VTNRTLRSLLQIGFTALLLGVLYLVRERSAQGPSGGPEGSTRPASAPPASSSAPDTARVAAAADGAVAEVFHARRSNLEVVAGGRVVRVLPDDRAGARHERFIVRIRDVSVLVAHNLDLAPRVPVSEGDSVELRGEYEWNPKGGVIHWTHRDPDGRHQSGWIRHRGRLYQ